MKYKVFGVGEILWDLLPTGRKLGGAPANFAYHAHVLGAQSRVVSRVGDDQLGQEIIDCLIGLGLSTECITVDKTHPTGTVTVKLSVDGQPGYMIHEGVAWDYLDPAPVLLDALEGADAVCFGSLGQRCENARVAIRALIGHVPRTAVRVFDVNLRENSHSEELLSESLHMTNVLKLNEQELPVIAGLIGARGSSFERMESIQKRFHLRLIACTCGGNGSILYNGETWSEHPGFQTEVKDTVGAGDSFTAAVTLGLLSGWPLDEISRLANRVAAYVCSCEGAMPRMTETMAQFKVQPSTECLP